MEVSSNAISKFQAVFRGLKSRQTHVARAKAGCKIICPFYASSNAVVDCMIKIADISSKDLVFDLGSGDGNILVNIAAQTGAKCVGIDIDPVLCATARRRSKQAGVYHSVDILVSDIEEVDISYASVICMFLVPSCLQELSDKLKRAFLPGIKIVCYKFELPLNEGWVPSATLETEDVININDPNSRSTVYYYQCP